MAERLNYLFQNIRSIEDKPYSAAEVARWIEDNGGEISSVYILKILNGERNEPSQRYLKDLARFFGVSPAFFWEDEPADLDAGELRERIVLRDGHLRLSEAVNARLDRQRLLGEVNSRRFTLLMTEGALRWMALSPAAMVRQLDRITEVVDLPQVAVGVIEWTTAADVFPMHGWDLYDDTAAVVGTETATGLITDRRDLLQYGQLFDRLEALASKGNAMTAALARLRFEYASLR